MKKCLLCKKEFTKNGNKTFCCLFCRIKFHSVEDENGCWVCNYLSKDKHGYTRIFLDRTRIRPAHRVMYEQYFDVDLINALKVCHKCDNPCCVNPDHLFIATHSENMQDCLKKNRWSNRKGSKNAAHKLKECDILQIRKRIKNGDPIEKICVDYNVCYQTIYLIKKNKTWKHVGLENDI